MGTQRKKPSSSKRNKARTAPAYPFEFRLKVVKLHLEDGYSAKLVAEQFGISDFSVSRWAKLYREHGEQDLLSRQRKPSGSKVPAAVTRSIVDLKKENPGYSIRRISDVHKRFFLIKASPSTVRRTLRDNNLNTSVKKKPKKNPAKPRFFERAQDPTRCDRAIS